MKKDPIYYKSIDLKNVKTFGETSLNFEKADGTLSQWTLILGDNSIGKSTLLQCLAWMTPQLPDGKAKIEEDFEVSPQIDDEENETLIDLVRRTQGKSIVAEVSAQFVSNRTLGRRAKDDFEKTCRTNIRIDIEVDNIGVRKLNDFVQNFLTTEDELDYFYQQDIKIFCYSAIRTLGSQNINDPSVENSIRQFISEKTVLYDSNEILHTANYAKYGASGEEKKKYTKFLRDVKKMLVSILPDFKEVNDIEILPPSMVNGKLVQQELMITTRHGKKIPFSSFSLGYKTTLSWTVDLAWRLFNEYPNHKEPLKQPAIVIIDEIDLHLHPVWQRRIMFDLSKHFPGVQFIATAHSALMVQAAFKANHAILKFGDEAVEIENEPEGIDGWRVDQILTSEFFGLQSARGLEFESLNKERVALLCEDDLDDKKKRRLANITKQLDKLPTGETSKEMQDRAFMEDFVSKVKERFRK